MTFRPWLPLHAFRVLPCAFVVAARAGISDKNSCCAQPQSRAESASYTGNNLALRGRRRDGAVDILPARLRRQGSQGWKNRVRQWLREGLLAALCAVF